MPNLPLLLGHRGVRAIRSVAENTFAAFDFALQHGCDGFEFDVRLAPGRRALVCHSPRVGRVTVSRATSRQLLHLPTLEEVWERYSERVFLDIELKVPGLEPKLLALLRDHPPRRDYVVSSFLPEVVMEMKARNARVPVGIICDEPAQLAAARKLPVEYVMPHEKLISRELVEEIQRTGRRLLAWTVNDKASMVRLSDWGVDGIISDDTRLLISTLRLPSKIRSQPDRRRVVEGKYRQLTTGN